MVPRNRVFVVLLLMGFLLLAGCEDLTTPEIDSPASGDSGGGEITETEASQVASGAMSAVSTAVSEAVADGLQGASTGGDSSASELESAATQNVNYTSTGVNVTGTMESSADGSFSYTLTTILDNYSSSAGNITGTLTVSGDMNGSTYTGSYKGSFVVVSGASNYTVELSWTLNSSGQFSGDYSVNGKSFSYTGGTDGDTGDDTGGGDDSVTTGLSVWTSVGDVGDISVYVNGSHRGTLTTHFPSGTPEFGQTGTITVSLSPGTHTVRAEAQAGGGWSEKSFTLQSGDRLLYHLDK